MCCKSDVLVESGVDWLLGLWEGWVCCARGIDERGLEGWIREDVGEVGFTGRKLSQCTEWGRQVLKGISTICPSGYPGAIRLRAGQFVQSMTGFRPVHAGDCVVRHDLEVVAWSHGAEEEGVGVVVHLLVFLFDQSHGLHVSEAAEGACLGWKDQISGTMMRLGYSVSPYLLMIVSRVIWVIRWCQVCPNCDMRLL